MNSLVSKRPAFTILVAVALFAMLPVACSATNSGEDDATTTTLGGDGSGAKNGQGGSGATDPTGGPSLGGSAAIKTVTLSGRVMAPSGAFPISGALVFFTTKDPPAIPSGAYNYKCDDLDDLPYTLSSADGKWTIDNVPVGSWKLVTRKGNFRRIRTIEVVENMAPAIPEEMTSLPKMLSADGLDTIPNFAVVKTTPDLTYNLLAKFGMGDVDGSGNLIAGTEQFSIYADSGGSYPHTSALFDSQQILNSYHMVFLPCNSSGVGVSFVNSHVDMLRNFVAVGGRLYNSCTVSLWTEATFPPYIDFYQSDAPTRFDIGRRTNFAYTTTGNVHDTDLAAWLGVVIPNDPKLVPFQNGYVTIDTTDEVADGHGLEKDGFVVKPYTWVSDNGSFPGSPLMVTYNYDYGKVFYSVYETSSGSAVITPQEYILLYVILEVGVCANPPDIPK
ncbi:MAG: carboxypeptidase-like regulatory domain-containing protein [Polyangiaceae bacterium]